MWTEVKPPNSDYNGIYVGVRCINLTKNVSNLLVRMAWGYVRIEYSLDNLQVRFTKGDRLRGHRIGKTGTITSKVGRTMPIGRYKCDVGKEELIFTKI